MTMSGRRTQLHNMLRLGLLSAGIAITAPATYCLASSPSDGGDGKSVASSQPASPPSKDKPLAAYIGADSITHHSLTLGTTTIAYTAHAGTLTLRDDKGEPTAKMFYVAYTRDGAKPEDRPVSFFFNGGPGAGSAFLNLGAAGPAVLRLPSGNPTDGANAKVVDNPDSWLRSTDMVFIDAVGTGYSLPLDSDKAAKTFYGVKQDAKAFAKAIELWVGANGRSKSPHYLVGESYGGIRSIEVGWALQMQQNMLLNGIVMISPAIEMRLLDVTDNPLGSALMLPSFIASELDRKHQLTTQNVDAAYRYALGPYLTTLANNPPKGQQAQDFYSQIASQTGIPVDVITKERGAPDPQAHDVRSRDGRLYTVYDGTLSIADPYPEGIDNGDSPDPVLFGFGRAYGSAFEGYASETLGYHTALTYDLLNLDVNAAWDYRGDGPVSQQIPLLRKLLALNPSLHVFIANGYFDLACPFSTTRWVVSHIPVGADRITTRLYPGGHMLYTRPDSRAALARDVQAFYTPAPNN